MRGHGARPHPGSSHCRFPSEACVGDRPRRHRSRAQSEQAVAQAEEAFGGIDVLVNNAGYGYNAGVEEGEESEVRAMFDTNFFGLVALTKRVLPGMRARKRGHVVNISSIGGLIGNPGSGTTARPSSRWKACRRRWPRRRAARHSRDLVEPGPFRTDFQGRSIKVPEAGGRRLCGDRRGAKEATARKQRQAGRRSRAGRRRDHHDRRVCGSTAAPGTGQDRSRTRARKPQRSHSLHRRLGRADAGDRLSKRMIIRQETRRTPGGEALPANATGP